MGPGTMRGARAYKVTGFSSASIENAFGPCSLVGWQFSADGKWDEAARFFYQGKKTDVSAWITRQSADNIAFEAMFTYADGRKFFIGVRITHLDAAQKTKVILDLLKHAQEGQTLDTVLQNIRAVLGNDNVIATSVDYLELGVFDLWNRVGSRVVWTGGELMSPKDIKGPEPDAGFQPLHEPQPQQLMLEGAWKPKKPTDFQAWIGLPVSDYTDDEKHHILSPEKYEKTAQILISAG